MKTLLALSLLSFATTSSAMCNLQIQSLESMLQDNSAFFKLQLAVEKKGYQLYNDFDSLQENDLTIVGVFSAGKVSDAEVTKTRVSKIDWYYGGFNHYDKTTGCQLKKEYVIQRNSDGRLRNVALVPVNVTVSNEKGCTSEMVQSVSAAIVKALPKCSSLTR